MTDRIREIMEQARQRAVASGKIHAGDLTPEEAHYLLKELPDARIIDVRTHPELEFVGVVPEARHVIWQHYPEMQVNPHFAKEVAVHAGPDHVLIFLCRTGGRSTAAAEHMTRLGYSHCFNVIGGFEGRKDEQGRRGTVDGWKAAGLPWHHK